MWEVGLLTACGVVLACTSGGGFLLKFPGLVIMLRNLVVANGLRLIKLEICTKMLGLGSTQINMFSFAGTYNHLLKFVLKDLG